MLDASHPNSRWLVLGPLAAGLASIVASFVLLVWLHRLKGAREKLMARQLWHLALADLIGCSLTLVWFVLEVLAMTSDVGKEQTRVLNTLCFVGICNNAFFMTSLLLEVHIAVSAAAALYRSQKLLRALSRSLVFVWPLGCAMCAIIVWPTDVHWNKERRICGSSGFRGWDFKAGAVIFVVCVCILTYVVGFVRASTHGGFSLQARIWNRTKFFLATTIMSWLPLVISYIFLVGHGRLVFHISFTFSMSNGFFNTCVYAVQSHFVARAHKRRSSSGNSVQQFHVGFRSEASVDEFTPTHKGALENAECETAALEERRTKAASVRSDFNELLVGDVTALMAELVAEDLFGCFDVSPHAPSDDATP